MLLQHVGLEDGHRRVSTESGRIKNPCFAGTVGAIVRRGAWGREAQPGSCLSLDGHRKQGIGKSDLASLLEIAEAAVDKATACPGTDTFPMFVATENLVKGAGRTAEAGMAQQVDQAAALG